MTAIHHDERTASGHEEAAAWLARDEVALAGVLGRITDLVAVRGEGAWLVDVEGRRTLDFASGIAVTNVGHCHPRVVAAVQEQTATLLHTSVTTHHTRRSSSPSACATSRRTWRTRRSSSATPEPRRSTAPSSWPAVPPASPAPSPSAGRSTGARWPRRRSRPPRASTARATSRCCRASPSPPGATRSTRASTRRSPSSTSFSRCSRRAPTSA
jgi:hypothetical protein